jgi:nucleoside-diphosphate-sugar epimerase
MSDDVILVTGLGGLIGGAVAHRLAAEGRRIIAADRVLHPGMPFPVVDHDLPEPHRWHDIIARFGITKVVHAGGISGPMLLRDQPARICEINLQGLTGLLETARIHGLRRIVWFSSITAYGDRPDLAPVTEDTPLHPTTVYAATKAAGEALLAAYHEEHGVAAVALRVASCYGPGRTTSCLICTMLEDGLAGRTTTVKERPDHTRQHVFVDDVVDAVVAALDAPALGQRIYNIGPGRAQPLAQIAAEIRTAVPGAAIEVREDGLAWNTFGIGPMVIDAARRDLGFEPRTSLAVGAARTRAWIEEHRTA